MKIMVSPAQTDQAGTAKDLLEQALAHLSPGTHQQARDLIGQAISALSGHRDEGLLPKDLSSSNDG
ncbi:hypothetical protein GCM10007276_10980 [Agaricicola taiwanensis]|uniref:Uncharacterized protein n=1 Tax=Agaricicola taiwanensis TaxID=591372 RepID=A0A8J2VSE4_9RHOB|nr:hypothetical protein [Agaricicola taiwanensis]GGE35274.1 hypothetical protein GCM10007276_10980 [Agaricicola taiwanensis]